MDPAGNGSLQMGSRKTLALFLICSAVATLLSGCATSGSGYSPLKKHHPDRLKEDFAVLRGALNDLHPSLDAYTPKAELDVLFEKCLSTVVDSMTETQFANLVVSRAVSAIRCGHTSVSLSKAYTKSMMGVRLPSFPLYVKTWGDTMVVTRNLNAGDSVIKKGTLITSIEGLVPAEIRRAVSSHLSVDGFNESLNEIRLSTSFPYYHRNVFGLRKEYNVGFIDSSGNDGYALVRCHVPEPDTLSDTKKEIREKPVVARPQKPGRRTRYSLTIDPDGKSAVMDIPSFQHSMAMKGFYRRSFRELHRRRVGHLVIDIRNNGGGNVDNQARLARYLKTESFRVADSAVAVRNRLGMWKKHMSGPLLNGFLLRFFTKKGQDGLYHLRYWERHLNRPKERHFFRGRVYVLIGGPTFSAASLFAGGLKGQANVTLVGEETGGGAHSNNGLLIPTLTLPNTGIRVRLPLFRLVPPNGAPRDGRGVMPDVRVGPTVDAVRKGVDRKMEAVRSLIAGAGER